MLNRRITQKRAILCDYRFMIISTVEEIEAAIGRLSRGEFWELTERLLAQRKSSGEEQLEEDVQVSELDALWASAENEIQAGNAEPLDVFLDNQKL